MPIKHLPCIYGDKLVTYMEARIPLCRAAADMAPLPTYTVDAFLGGYWNNPTLRKNQDTRKGTRLHPHCEIGHARSCDQVLKPLYAAFTPKQLATVTRDIISPVRSHQSNQIASLWKCRWMKLSLHTRIFHNSRTNSTFRRQNVSDLL
jgi:hypothetical protein